MNNEYLEYQMACTEVLEVLKFMPKKDVVRIPDDVIKTLKSSKRYDYKFRYNVNKTLDEQNISKKARTMLSIFYRDYWAPTEVRNIIKLKEERDRKKKEM